MIGQILPLTAIQLPFWLPALNHPYHRQVSLPTVFLMTQKNITRHYVRHMLLHQMYLLSTCEITLLTLYLILDVHGAWVPDGQLRHLSGMRGNMVLSASGKDAGQECHLPTQRLSG